ncbi:MULTISPECIES: SMI1/KNR4 family protein [unclassified Myroides]|uniref:SMI1/KNR4 family protein n=1 Tax=unclassified Myroides TaxID=2642485 RepID=UPI003D2F681F
MKKNMENIDQWLQLNAAKIHDFSLQHPATLEEVEQLERTVGKTLPQDFKDLYFWHNGLNEDENCGSLFYGMDFYPIDQVIASYLDKKENYTTQIIPLEHADLGIDPSHCYNPHWVEFAFDGSHTHLYLDLSPAKEGQYGQIIFVDDEYERGILVASSTASLIADFDRDLQQGLYFLDEDALEDDNHYLETHASIDLVNWYHSEKWKR